jgi:DNA replication protein DnaC
MVTRFMSRSSEVVTALVELAHRDSRGSLATLRFLDNASNVLPVSPPGVGKTMLAVALAC